jgi:hypothetical protein
MLQPRPSSTLDGGDFGWLKANYYFAVSPDGNPANGRPLGALVVWNDDEIVPGKSFGLHGHANMEIISYIPRGRCHPSRQHRKCRAHKGRRRAGDQRRDRHSAFRTQSRHGALTLISDLTAPPRRSRGISLEHASLPKGGWCQPICCACKRAARRQRGAADPRRCQGARCDAPRRRAG